MSSNPDMTTILNAHNAQFIGELYELYMNNSDAVDNNWQVFFDDICSKQDRESEDFGGPSWDKGTAKVIGSADPNEQLAHLNQNLKQDADPDIRRATLDSLRAIMPVSYTHLTLPTKA